MENLQIGTYGWHHENWLESFYPDDLPEDWQLDYFSNAYRVLLVPMNDWLSWQPSDLEEVADSVEAPFYFFFAVDSVLDSQQLQQLNTVVKALAESVAGIVVWHKESIDQLKSLNLPITLISSDVSLPGWSWQSEGVIFSGSPLVLLTELPSDGREQAALLRSFVGSLPTDLRGVPFIIGGEQINMEHVANLKTVGELLGF